jgi:hypothetical protein
MDVHVDLDVDVDVVPCRACRQSSGAQRNPPAAWRARCSGVRQFTRRWGAVYVQSPIRSHTDLGLVDLRSAPLHACCLFPFPHLPLS